MVALVFPLVAFLATLLGTLRSLGWGFIAVFAVGYFNGVIRANYLSIATTFMFDAALLGLYVGFLVGHPRDAVGVWQSRAGQWTLALIIWPVVLTLIPVNHFLVQLVALRATVWFVPVLLMATRLRAADLTVITRGFAVLNLVALGGGLYVYQNGIAALYPENAVTAIMYLSKDVAGFQYHRVPSFFLSAHAYGGAMLFSLPFLIGLLFNPRETLVDRGLATLGVAAAVGGILLCAARVPVVLFVLMSIVAWIVARFHPVVGIAVAGVVVAAVSVAAGNERLQRAITLGDTEIVSDRLQASANESFLELMVDYPAGAGMGSSYGTSIPFFLAQYAPPAIGMENEYSRILVDQGLVGLGLWLAFLAWMLLRPPPSRFRAPWGVGVVFMYAVVVVTWATAFIGAGALSAIPGSVLLLTQMGVLLRVRAVAEGRAP
ncbi:MAG TPA: hypothetical protein VM529_09705 [Gemmata sp.]|jgi:hypothetical protein|nr:hypothetical protein [Gemmata sp.]